MNKYEIEKGIPIPKHMRKEGANVFDKMEIGDSVLFDKDDWKWARNRAMCNRPKVFTFRSCDGGYRCWRIE